MAIIYLDTLHVNCYFDSSLRFSCVSTDTARLLGRLDSVSVLGYPVEGSNLVSCVLVLRIDDQLRVCVLGIDYFAGIKLLTMLCSLAKN